MSLLNLIFTVLIIWLAIHFFVLWIFKDNLKAQDLWDNWTGVIGALGVLYLIYYFLIK